MTYSRATKPVSSRAERGTFAQGRRQQRSLAPLGMTPLLASLFVRHLRRLAEIFAGQSALDQAHDVVAAVELDEGAHARALLAAQQDLIEGLEPLAQLFLGEMALARLVDLVLDELRALALGDLAQRVGEVLQRGPLLARGQAELLGALHEVLVVGHRTLQQAIEIRRVLGRG